MFESATYENQLSFIMRQILASNIDVNRIAATKDKTDFHFECTLFIS